MTKSIALGVLTAVAMAAAPAQAGEVTGNGKDITMHANSACAFSDTTILRRDCGCRSGLAGRSYRSIRAVGPSPTVRS